MRKPKREGAYIIKAAERYPVRVEGNPLARRTWTVTPVDRALALAVLRFKGRT